MLNMTGYDDGMHAFEDIETLEAALTDLGGLLAERDVTVSSSSSCWPP